VMRVLDQFDIHLDLTRRWDGKMSVGGAPDAEEKASEE
jgi:hypothetical protein